MFCLPVYHNKCLVSVSQIITGVDLTDASVTVRVLSNARHCDVSTDHVTELLVSCSKLIYAVRVLRDLRSATAVVARRVSCNRGSETVVRYSCMVRLLRRGRSISP